MNGGVFHPTRWIMTSTQPALRKRPKRLLPRPTSRWERRLRLQGYRNIAGIDEVGRGCLFGPVVAAAVILDPGRPVRGLNDSKVLDAERREVLSSRIRERARSYAVGAVDCAGIDRWNIYQAARRAMCSAVRMLSIQPDYLLVDALEVEVDLPQKALIGGDSRSTSIAAASIVAKVERDRWMRLWDKVYPQYNLASNKGYTSPHHIAALERFGPTPLHRRSFRPVQEASRFSVFLANQEEYETLPLFPEIEAGENH